MIRTYKVYILESNIFNIINNIKETLISIEISYKYIIILEGFYNTL